MKTREATHFMASTFKKKTGAKEKLCCASNNQRRIRASVSHSVSKYLCLLEVLSTVSRGKKGPPLFLLRLGTKNVD